MSKLAIWFVIAASAVASVAQAVTAADVAVCSSSGFPSGTLYHPDPPYHAISMIDVFRTPPAQSTSLVLRGAGAVIGLVWPGRLASTLPRILAEDGTPLVTRATLSPPDTLETGDEASNRLLTLETSPSKPGTYRLVTADAGSGARDLVVVDGSAYAVDVWMPSLFYAPAEPPIVYARLYNAQTGAPVLGFRVTARANFPGLHGAVLKDDGVAPDEVANDGVYAGTLTTRHVWSVEQLRRHGGEVEVKVKAHGRVDGLGMRRTAVTGFNWCVGSAAIDAIQPASVESSPDGKSIVVPVMMTATQQGHYHLEGNLVGRNGELVAFGEAEVWLVVGSNTMPLSFDAGIVAAAGVGPPYTLRKVLLQEEGAGGPVMVDSRENLGTINSFTFAQLGPAATPIPEPDDDEELFPPGG